MYINKPTDTAPATSALAGKLTSNTLTTNDGTVLYYKDWGSGPAVVFSHGYPLSSDAWEYQMLFLSQHGYRVIAHDRRGFGRSSQPGQGYDYDTFADDLAALIDALDLNDVTLVGHSMGGGEVARYIGRHGEQRVRRPLSSLRHAVPAEDGDQPNGAPREFFDGLRRPSGRPLAVEQRRDAALLQLQPARRPGVGRRARGLLASGNGDRHPGGHLRHRRVLRNRLQGDLAKISVPTLVIHGTDDQIVPIEISGNRWRASSSTHRCWSMTVARMAFSSRRRTG